VPPLADLHRHLDGSLRPATLVELAQKYSVTLPADIRFFAGMGLDAALQLFSITLDCLQEPDAVARVASEMCEDAAREGVGTLEIRFAPQLHKGADVAHIVDAALSGAAGRAGLILCGLYGESPSVLEHLVDVAIVRRGVVGIDLAGGPAPFHTVGMADYAPAFEKARRHGIGRTVHAAEGRPPSEIRTAVTLLGAQRIGHGTTILDDPSVVALVVERQVVLEACPTSNVHTGVIADVTQHPLAAWLRLGIRACINTDNTLLSDVDAPEEYQRVRGAVGMDDTLLALAVQHGHQAAFHRE